MSTLVKTRRTTKQTQVTSQRRLFLEGLERRAVLAGDVWAAQVGGNLMLRGDAEDNGIHLQTMADGTVEVSGMEAGGSPTTINGSPGPFVASNVRFLTRVHLGNGDDTLLIDSEASGDTVVNSDVNSDPAADVSANASATIVSRLRGLLNGGLAAAVNGSAGFQSRPHLLINTGNGNDTVDATVAADVDVHLAGNLRGDSISIETMPAETDAELTLTAEGNVSTDSNVELGGNAAVDMEALDAALAAEVNAGLDAAGQLAAGGIGLNTDLDTALTANLALSSALNSATNLGPSSLLNSDQNLNGSIGGAAALNLAGDTLFDEFGLFNSSSLANVDAELAAQLALANANNFGMAANNVDDFFANQNGQNNLGANTNANIDAGLLATLGNNDVAANGSLNTNVNASLSNAYQSRLGVPLG